MSLLPIAPSMLIPARDAKPERPLALLSEDNIGTKVLLAVYFLGTKKEIITPTIIKTKTILIIVAL
jgi:hypothetical protein